MPLLVRVAFVTDRPLISKVLPTSICIESSTSRLVPVRLIVVPPVIWIRSKSFVSPVPPLRRVPVPPLSKTTSWLLPLVQVPPHLYQSSPTFIWLALASKVPELIVRSSSTVKAPFSVRVPESIVRSTLTVVAPPSVYVPVPLIVKFQKVSGSMVPLPVKTTVPLVSLKLPPLRIQSPATFI
ncbi:hypothetical protein ES708_11634 [subsurface metagenome]